MRFTSVEITNFGPYLGKQTLDLPVGEQSVLLIHGDNMSGKTSLFNAMRWCLYGVAKDRAGSPIPTKDLLNVNAYYGGNKFVSVTIRMDLDLDAGGSELVLTRQKQGKKGLPLPEKEEDFEELLFVEQDGKVLTPNDFSELVGDLIPEEISRFFLFDGELLKEYEALVREGGEREGRVVRESIEMILGLPSVTNGRDDVLEVKRELDKRLGSEARRSKKAEEASFRLEELNGNLDVARADLKSLRAQEEKASCALRDIDENLKQFEESREDAGRKVEIERQLDSVVARRRELMKERRESASEIWRDILAPRIQAKLGDLEQELKEQSERSVEIASLIAEARKLEQTLDSGMCEACGQEIGREHKAKASAELGSIDRRIESLKLSYDEERYKSLQGITANLRKVAPAGVVQAIRQLEQQIAETRVEEDKRIRELRRIKERLGNVDDADVRRYEKQRRSYETEIGRLREQISVKEQDISDLKSEAAQQRDIVLKNQGDGFSQLKVERDLVDALEGIFDKAVERLTDELRREVEARATDVFKRLTTDKSYSGLSINEKYGLTILLENGEPISVRSAGAEQVVALSLIAALNMLAAKRGPVIMDTPLGRLDKKHRSNILKFLPTLAEQVVLMVHDGEVDRKQDLEPIAPWVGGEYEIHHPSSTESQLMKIGGLG